MSFRTAYSDAKRSRRANPSRGYYRDPTPEEWKRKMDEYYVEQQRKKAR